MIIITIVIITANSSKRGDRYDQGVGVMDLVLFLTHPFQSKSQSQSQSQLQSRGTAGAAGATGAEIRGITAEVASQYVRPTTVRSAPGQGPPTGQGLAPGQGPAPGQYMVGVVSSNTRPDGSRGLVIKASRSLWQSIETATGGRTSGGGGSGGGGSGAGGSGGGGRGNKTHATLPLQYYVLDNLTTAWREFLALHDLPSHRFDLTHTSYHHCPVLT